MNSNLFKDIEDKYKKLYINCDYCPRNCNINRLNEKKGYCFTGAGFNVGSICIHRGEEPVISGRNGIINIFFTRCNLACIYCQNHQITKRNGIIIEYELSFENIINRILDYIKLNSCYTIGFVSPSHNFVQVLMIIEALRTFNYPLIFVYNSNGYDKVETLKKIEGFIDIYLPDFKYINSKTAQQYSAAIDYPINACAAIKEMYRQKGSSLILNENDDAESGLIIRHLVLPGHAKESIEIFKFIADEISTAITISVMSQYYVTNDVKSHPVLGRKIFEDEYNIIVEEIKAMGFYKGWFQSFESQQSYLPDFNQSHPFENNC